MNLLVFGVVGFAAYIQAMDALLRNWRLRIGDGEAKLGTFPFSKYTHRVIETLHESFIARRSQSSIYMEIKPDFNFFLSIFSPTTEHLDTLDE